MSKGPNKVLCALCHSVEAKKGVYCKKHAQAFTDLAKLDGLEEFGKILDKIAVPLAKEIAQGDVPFNAMMAIRARRHEVTGRFLINVERIR